MKQRLIFTSILFFTLSSSLLSQSVSEMRSFSRSLNADRDTRLEVNNRYGDVHLTSWNRDSIYIKAEIEATANSTSKLKNLLEGIEISISESGRSVRAETKFVQ